MKGRKKEGREERNKERKETEEGPAISIELYVGGVWSEGYRLYSSDSQPSARWSVRDPSWPNHHPPPTPPEDKLELVPRPQRTWMGLRGRLAQTASPCAPSLSPGASAAACPQVGNVGLLSMLTWDKQRSCARKGGLVSLVFRSPDPVTE